jgi:hypothetical protein
LATLLKASRKFRQGQPNGVADSFQLQHVYSPLALLVLADAGLGDSKSFRELGLSQFRIHSDATKEAEEYLSITLSLSRKSSDPLHARSIGTVDKYSKMDYSKAE